MLINAKTLKGYKLDCFDGEIGKVKDFYFDDRHWAIRYLVADTGKWLTSRQVLISPHALVAAIKEDHDIVVNLTKNEIEESPSLNTDKPVSRQFEESYYEYYDWPMYWSGGYMWGSSPYIDRERVGRKESNQDGKAWDHHLRSTDVVTGYHLSALDGEIGHIEDFIIDDETWAIRYMIVGTKNWWPGKKVLVSPQWIERVSWNESKVFINLSRTVIQESPEYTAESLLNREYENGLHNHYKRKGYWIDELAAV